MAVRSPFGPHREIRKTTRSRSCVPSIGVQTATEVKMKTHNFTIVASSPNEFSVMTDRLFEAGCDDATVSLQKGLLVLEFDREARTFVHAIMTALQDVAKTGAVIERIEPDYLVSAAEIAKRSSQSRASVSLYAKGERGVGFPRPIARVTTESPLWDWADVSAWLHREAHLSLSMIVEARAVRELNKVLVEKSQPSSYLGRKLERARLNQSGSST